MKKLLLLAILVSGLSVKAQTPGTLDTSFGTNGTVEFVINNAPTSSFQGFSAYGTVVNPDNSLMNVGITEWGCNANSSYEGYTLKFTANGQLDQTFGTNGKKSTGQSYANSLQRMPSGSYLGKYINTIRKLDAAGNFDTSFQYSLPTMRDFKLLASGDILTNSNIVSGNTYYPSITKVNPNGTVNTAFGNNGTLSFSTLLGLRILSFDMDAAGNYVFVGRKMVQPDFPNSSNTKIIVIKTDANGNLLNSFGQNGIYLSSIETTESYYLEAFVQPDSSIVIISNSFSPYPTLKTHMMKLNSSGQLDMAFSNGFKTMSNTFNLRQAFIHNNKIYAYGLGSTNKYCLTRFSINGVQETGFNNTGYIEFPIINTNSKTSTVYMQNDRLIIKENADYYPCGNNNYKLYLRRFFIDNSNLSVNNLVTDNDDSAIYPNPAKGNFIFIKTKKLTSLTIFSQEGRLIREMKDFSMQDNTQKIDISSLPKGVYMFRLKTSEGDFTRKVIKE
ncbi:hypothetical protein ASG01_11790 [Chryseobacterium sp. Leaf180]|uniref:T9SS type A sorting domain-containing protein n=1 Tax=Chryseobacterium sp. Leaf180 TaxID=1736289 RepID=UPI0006FE5D0D|nr:T9SS type A sorting domain-containing protein [Chryseobacterium sp. Leaf180]KQR92580.1 hypothetical protein ASG01_11790 [Chryseobacterium sp. Leaf180]